MGIRPQKGFYRTLDKGDFDRINLPREFWTAKVDRIQGEARKSIEGYLERLYDAIIEGAGLCLYGKPGVGKSAIAAIVAKQARSIGFSTYFTSFWELRDNIKNDTKYDDAYSVYQWCRGVDLLVLDNLRPEDTKTSDWHLPVRSIEDLISYRRDNKLTTIVTTQIEKAVSDRDAIEAGGDVPMSFDDIEGITSALRGAVMPMPIVGVDLREVRAKELRTRFLTPKGKI